MTAVIEHPPLARRGARLLVAVQGLLFAALVAVALLPPVGPALVHSPILALVLAGIGSVGLVAGGLFLGRALTPSPLPNGAGLAARGLYSWVRHPMYTSLVLLAAGVAASEGAVLPWVITVLLAAFFEFKTRAEEAYLLRVYPGYAEYAARTGKFLPGIGMLR